MVERYNESGLDEKLRNSGEEQLVTLVRDIPVESLLGSSALGAQYHGGLMDSLSTGRGSRSAFKKQRYQSGVDRPTAIDVNSIFQGDGSEITAIKSRTKDVPATVHTLLDLPERHEKLTGDYRTEDIARRILSLTTFVAKAGRTSSDVYLRDGTGRAGLIEEDITDDMYMAFRHLDGEAEPDRLEECGPSLSSQIEQVCSRIKPERDAVVLVSDFLDEYDEQSHSFGWEDALHNIRDELGDRLWGVRVTSPAQQQYPDIINDAMSHDVIAAMNHKFAALAERKQEALGRALKPLEQQKNSRLLTVDTFRDNNEQHPVQAMSKFVLGETV